MLIGLLLGYLGFSYGFMYSEVKPLIEFGNERFKNEPLVTRWMVKAISYTFFALSPLWFVIYLWKRT